MTGKILLLAVSSCVWAADRPPLPRAWSSYRTVDSIDKDFADLKAHGVGLVSIGARDVAEAKQRLAAARRFGMKYHISLPEITEQAGLVRDAGLQPMDALMIGGVYRGKAIDRYLFRFTAGKHEILVEPPVYDKGFAYTLGSRSTGARAAGEPIGHYFLEMPDPVRAEIVVPLRKFDGKQHLKIVPAVISPAPPGATPENDSVTPAMPASSETKNRKLYRVSFDLTGIRGALLDQVGVAVYWPYHGSSRYWMFGRGTVSAAAESTRQALRIAVQKELRKWSDANGGSFPGDVVMAARFGDECFYTTGHSRNKGAAMVNYPLWEYSAPSIQVFRKHAGSIEYPRTWGFPEIYGDDAYGWWMYSLHEQTAALAGIVREEIAKTAPGLLVFRNTTRNGVFDLSNDHDGSGQELLARNLDIVHLDPYPVSSGRYNATTIPRDMSYSAGLARRYHRLLIPWMQAHIYGDLQHVTPDHVDRMAREQWAQGVDAVMWLGYGDTFPKVRPDSWERAAAFHKQLAASLPPTPQAKLAVLRSYNAWAVSSLWEDQIRNPADWMLQQLLDVWAVQRGQPYDVFEVPPRISPAERTALEKELKRYPYVVSTLPWKGALVVSEPQGRSVDPATAQTARKSYEAELARRGWLK